MSPLQLERYSFYWSELRLVIAAVALFLGGIPPVKMFLPSLPLISTLLSVAWIISGIAAAYLLYRWLKADQKLFGHKNTLDTISFYVSVISGLNLGIVGVFGINIGMSITTNYVVFMIAGLVYLAAAYHLFTRFNAHKQHLF